MSKFDYKDPRIWLALGFAAVVLALTVPVIPNWRTFIHMWPFEMVASVVLVLSLSYILIRSAKIPVPFSLHRRELYFIVLPVAAFIVWSALSISWAPSWKSAAHHSLVWSEYLIFYLLVRSAIDSKGGYRRILVILTAAFVFVSLPAIVEYASLLMFGGGTSLGLRYARYGEQVNTLIPLVIAAVVAIKNTRRFWLGTAAVAAMWLLIFVSLGRTNIALFGLAAASVGGCVFLFKRFHSYRLRIVLIFLALIAAPIPLHLFSFLSSDPGIPVLRRVNNEAAISSSNGFRKLMASISIEMFRQHPLTGVGADNFGMQLNDDRAAYAAKNPDDPNLVNAENEIPERSHNEYLQILAELGIVGGLIFAWLLVGVGLIVFRVLKDRRSLTALAAASGVVVFLLSSLVTSYSFRLIQNGFVFFFVLAIAAKFLLRDKGKRPNRKIVFSPGQVTAASLLGVTLCLALICYSSLRVASVIYAAKADAVQDLDEAIPIYERSISLDSENPDAEFSLGFRLMDAKRYTEAARHLERSIKIGRGPSVSYSYLATAYLMGGHPDSAERSFEDAVTLYPLSSFARTRHAFLLSKAGKMELSELELEKARKISTAGTATWWTFMNDGPRKATENANADKTISPTMDLTPTAAIYAVLFERIIEHPEEKSTLDFMK